MSSIALTVIAFATTDLAAVSDLCRRSGVQGYVYSREDTCEAVVLGNELRLNALQRLNAGKIPIEICLKPGAVNISFTGLQEITIARHPAKTRVTIGRVNPRGCLVGWAISEEADFAKVAVFVDGEQVATGPANVFREDLLKVGLGFGAHGYSFRLPERYLDTSEHRIRVELLGREPQESGGTRPIDGSAEKLLKTPFHFNLPRPWVSSEVAASTVWSMEEERNFRRLRDDLIYGSRDGVIADVREFIEETPSAILRDWGIRDRFKLQQEYFPLFKARLDQRSGRMFGPRLCKAGPACCKLVDLPYNARQPGAVRPSDPHGFRLENSRTSAEQILAACHDRIRHFASKQMTKIYADQHGIETPATFGLIRSLEEFDDLVLPNRFVLKPDFASGVGLYLMHGDLNLFDGFCYPREEVRDALSRYLNDRRRAQFILEEFLLQEGTDESTPFVPLDYKFHCFGGRARIVHVDDRNTVSWDGLHRRQSWFSRDWVETPFPMRFAEQPNNPISPPRCYEQMLNIADQIAADLGDYVRVDLYATDRGPVLGEVTSYSHSGLGFSDFGDLLLAQAWEIFPSLIAPDISLPAYHRATEQPSVNDDRTPTEDAKPRSDAQPLRPAGEQAPSRQKAFFRYLLGKLGN